MGLDAPRRNGVDVSTFKSNVRRRVSLVVIYGVVLFLILWILAEESGITIDLLWLSVFVLMLVLIALVFLIPDRVDRGANGWSFVGPVLGVLVAIVALLEGLVGAPAPPGEFLRVAGATRTETSLEASRLWSDPRHYLIVNATNDADYVAAGQCAAVAGIPLLIAPAGTVDWTPPAGRSGHLRDADPVTWQAERGCTLEKPSEWVEVRYDKRTKSLLGKSEAVTLDATATEPSAALAVLAARAEDGSTPDVAVGLAVAAHLSRQREEVVVQHLVDPVLLANKKLERELAASITVVRGGVVIGGERAVPARAANDVRTLLSAQDWRGSLGSLQKFLSDSQVLAAAVVGVLGAVAANHAGRTEGPDGKPRTLASTLASSFAPRALMEASDESASSKERATGSPLRNDGEPPTRVKQALRWLKTISTKEDKVNSKDEPNEDQDVGVEVPDEGIAVRTVDGVLDLFKNGELCCSIRVAGDKPILLPVSDNISSWDASKSTDDVSRGPSQPRGSGYYLEWVASQPEEAQSQPASGDAPAGGRVVRRQSLPAAEQAAMGQAGAGSPVEPGRAAQQPATGEAAGAGAPVDRGRDVQQPATDEVSSDALLALGRIAATSYERTGSRGRTEYVFHDDSGHEVARVPANKIARIYPGNWWLFEEPPQRSKLL